MATDVPAGEGMHQDGLGQAGLGQAGSEQAAFEQAAFEQDGFEQDGFDRLSGELARLNRLLERAQARLSARSPDGVERAASILLAHLVQAGPRRLSALAEAVHSDASTVSRQVAQLVRSGLVDRRPDPADGRAGVLAATDAGRRVFEAKRARHNRDIAEVLRGWDPGDQATLRSLLGRFNDDYERHHVAQVSKPASLARAQERSISSSASRRPAHVEPSTLLPGSRSL